MARTPAERRLYAALEELATEDVVELIAEARQDARARVRSWLSEALTEAMLNRARREVTECADNRPEPPPQPARDRQQEREPGRGRELSTEGTGVYVYCVVPSDTRLPQSLPAIDPAHAPMLICHERLAAVVSQVPLTDFGEERLRERLADMRWLERIARAHELALETIGSHATLIPMRLCSVYRSDLGVAEMLAREARALEEALVHLEGKHEWGVKAFTSPPKGPSGPAHGPADSGTDYMERRRTDRERRRHADQQLHDACVAIHERLAAVVADATTSPPQRSEVSGHSGEMLLNGVYLVEDDQRTTFLTLVNQLKSKYSPAGLDVEATGPWPAYNFVPGTIGAAW